MSGENPTRWCTLRAKSARVLEAYLPDNYKIAYSETLPDGSISAVVEGKDVAGWTLDDYVIPRLASGGMSAFAASSYLEARETASSVMN